MGTAAAGENRSAESRRATNPLGKISVGPPFGSFFFEYAVAVQEGIGGSLSGFAVLLERCLRDACARGFLVREGKRRYTFPKQGKKSESEILFITRSTSWGAFHPVSEREMDFLRCAYRLGAEKHYQLRLLGFDEKSGRFVDRNGCVHSLSDFPRAVGAMVSTLLVQKPLKLLNALISAGFPISVWWEHPHSDLDGTFLKKAGWMFFNSAFGKNPESSWESICFKKVFLERFTFLPIMRVPGLWIVCKG